MAWPVIDGVFNAFVREAKALLAMYMRSIRATPIGSRPGLFG